MGELCRCPQPHLRNTGLTVSCRVQVQGTPVLHFPVCKISRPLPKDNSAFGTPHHTTPHHTTPHRTTLIYQHTSTSHHSPRVALLQPTPPLFRALGAAITLDEQSILQSTDLTVEVRRPIVDPSESETEVRCELYANRLAAVVSQVQYRTLVDIAVSNVLDSFQYRHIPVYPAKRPLRAPTQVAATPAQEESKMEVSL